MSDSNALWTRKLREAWTIDASTAIRKELVVPLSGNPAWYGQQGGGYFNEGETLFNSEDEAKSAMRDQLIRKRDSGECSQLWLDLITRRLAELG